MGTAISAPDMMTVVDDKKRELKVDQWAVKGGEGQAVVSVA